MQTFSVYLRPEDPASGLPEYATCIEVRAAWLAKFQAMAMLDELAPDTAHQYAEPLVCEDRPGLPRPAMNVLSTDFLKTCYWDEENQVFAERPQPASKPVNFDALSSDQKMAVLVRHGTPEIDSEQFSDALQLLNGERDTPEGHIVESLIRTKGIAAMYPEVVLGLIGELGNHFDGADNWPQMKAFNEKWLKDRKAARKDSGDKVTTLRTTSGTTAGGGNLTDRGTGHQHDFDSLRREIALGLHARAADFNIYDLRSAQINRAREIIKLKEKPFPAWSAAMCATPGILDYSRAMIIYTVKTAPDDIHLTPGALQAYINKTLTETDHANPDPRIVAIACGRPTDEGNKDDDAQQEPQNDDQLLADADQNAGEVEQNTEQPDDAAPGTEDETPLTRTPPFYVRDTDGKPRRANKLKGLEDLLALGCTEISKDEYQQLKNTPAASDKPAPSTGTAHEEHLAANINDVQIVEAAPGKFSAEAFLTPDASSEGEKTEVDPLTPESEAAQREVYAGPGIYHNISNADYHAGPGVSKSQLDDIAIDPAFFLWRKAAPVDTEKTAALDMGTALHCLLLEPDEYNSRFIIAPEFNRRTTAGKEEEKAFIEGCQQSGKIIISHADNRKLQLMRDSVMAHPGARKLLEVDGRSEASIYWNDAETGELCRIRPDRFLTNTPFIVDVKKVADMSRFSRHIEEFRYHVQAAMYCEGWRAHTGEMPRFVFLAVSESIECGRYPVHTYILDNEAMEEGYRLFRQDLETWHRCNESGEWGWGFEEIQRPYWARG